MESYQRTFNEALYGDDPNNPGGLIGDLSTSYKEWYKLTKGILTDLGV
jgi:hypothetical protein